MSFRNLMEDIVTNVVNKILFKEDQKLLEYEPYKQDIITYVLNRIPPKYYTSERGILHGKLETEFTFQQKADILILTYEAIEIIINRRSTELPGDTKSTEYKVYCLPHILGEVLEQSTFSIIPDIKVQLLYKGKTVRMKDSTWKNPYNTSKATEGYYHFWPEIPKSSEKDIIPGVIIPFEIVFNHPSLIEKRIGLDLQVMDSINVYRSQVIPITLIQAADGIDIESLIR
jgi:competence protein ComFB